MASKVKVDFSEIEKIADELTKAHAKIFISEEEYNNLDKASFCH